MGAPHLPRVEIEDPFDTVGWRVSRPDDEGTLHAEVLRELCERALPLHVGGAGASGANGVTATLQVVDMLQQQVVLASQDDGLAVARALQARPAWAAAQVRGLRVQFALAAASVTRERGEPSGQAAAVPEGVLASPRAERFLIRARWPREIFRTSRRRVPRLAAVGLSAAAPPVLRICGGHQLVSTRDLRVLDLSELGCAVLLPAGMVPPALGTMLTRVELELTPNGGTVVLADARVRHVAATGRNSHRLGCRWESLSSAGQLALRRWLAAAAKAGAATAPALEAG